MPFSFMIVVKKITISQFRSCRDTPFDELGNFTVLSGRNNSGKSNILRALSLFFSGKIEPNTDLDIIRDCSAPKGKKKQISLTVQFSLDERIKIQKNLSAVKSRIPKDAEITKVYSVDLGLPVGYRSDYLINGDRVNESDKFIVDQFLNLFNFRYITADRTARSVLEQNLPELQAELNYRLNIRIPNASGAKSDIQPSAIEVLNSLSDELFEPITQEVNKADSRIKRVKLSTPEKLTELIRSAKYQIQVSEEDILSESVQGSGIQSLLLFTILVLIDRNFHRKFGWKVATIWAIEEPEIFLHHDLEEQLGKYFADLTCGDSSRFQIIATSHSTSIPQFADAHYIVSQIGSKSSESTTVCAKLNLLDFLDQVQAARITTIIHALTLYPHKKIVLVEGEIDEFVIRKICNDLKNVEIFSISRFLSNSSLRGADYLIKFLEANEKYLDTRVKGCGVIAVFDWDKDPSDLRGLRKKMKAPNHCFQFKKEDSNPELDATFRGIEKFYDSEIIIKLYKQSQDLIYERQSAEPKFFCEKGKKYMQVKHELFEIVKTTDMKFTFFKSLYEFIQNV